MKADATTRSTRQRPGGGWQLSRATLATLALLACASKGTAPSHRHVGDDKILASGAGPRAQRQDPNASLDWLVLHDIQGLYGGYAIFLQGDGRLVAITVQVSSDGLEERRYESRLEPPQMSALLSLFRTHDLMNMSVPDRLGIPDEARAELRVALDTGARSTLAKWAGVRHAGFQAVADWLYARVKELSSTAPVHSGPWAGDWQPPGPWRRSSQTP